MSSLVLQENSLFLFSCLCPYQSTSFTVFRSIYFKNSHSILNLTLIYWFFSLAIAKFKYNPRGGINVHATIELGLLTLSVVCLGVFLRLYPFFAVRRQTETETIFNRNLVRWCVNLCAKSLRKTNVRKEGNYATLKGKFIVSIFTFQQLVRVKGGTI